MSSWKALTRIFYNSRCLVFQALRCLSFFILTHWGRVTHICVNHLTIIGSDNGLSPNRRQAIIRTNAGILLIRPLGTHFTEFLVEILIFSFKKMRLKASSAKRRPFCLGLNELTNIFTHWSLLTPHGVIKRRQWWCRWWLVDWRYQAITRTNIVLL